MLTKFEWLGKIFLTYSCRWMPWLHEKFDGCIAIEYQIWNSIYFFIDWVCPSIKFFLKFSLNFDVFCKPPNTVHLRGTQNGTAFGGRFCYYKNRVKNGGMVFGGWYWWVLQYLKNCLSCKHYFILLSLNKAICFVQFFKHHHRYSLPFQTLNRISFTLCKSTKLLTVSLPY